jgi:fibronectin-binding autotransporter adhesin
MATVTAFTWTGTGGFASGMSVTRTFTFGTTGGSTTTAPNLFINSGSSVPTFTDGSWFEILDFTGSSCAPAMSASVIGIYVDTLTLATGGTFTGLIPVFTRTQTWTAQFSKQLGGIGVNIPSGTLTLDSTQTYSATSSTILTAGTLDLGGADLTTGLLSSSNANTRAIAFGANKIILAHTTAATTVLAMANATGFTYTGTGLFNTDASVTRTLTFGTTAGSTTNAPSLTLTGSGTAVITLTTASWYNNLDFGTTAFTIGTTTLNLNGNLTLSTGGTFTGLSATMVGTGSINSNGGAIAALVVNNDVGTTSLTAALSCTTFTMTAGTIDFNFFNLTCSGAVTYTSGTMLDMPTITCTTWTVAGTFTMTSGTITPSVSFVLSSGAFNYNGGTLSPVPTFTHTAGTVTLGQAYALTATGTYTLTAGTLNLNGFNLTTGAFSSSNTNTRSIVFGAGNIVLAHTTVATTVLSMATATGFTNTGTGGFVTDASITRTVTFGTTGGASTISPNLTLTGSGAAVITFTTASWFNKLDFGTTAFTIGTTTLNLNSFTLSSTGTFTTLTANMVDDGTIVNNGNNTLGALTINSTTGTTSLGDAFTISAIAATTLTSGTLNLNGFDLTTGSFSSTNANTRAITFGSNNIVLAHVLAGTTVLSMATTTGFTWTGTGGFTTNASVTRTYVFGTTGGSATNAPNLLITSGASVPTFTDGSWFNTLSFTGTTCTPAVTASAIGIYVSTLTLATGGTYTSLIPVFTRTQTWTAQFSKQLGGIGVNGTGVTLTLDNTQTYTATSAVFLVAGTIDLGGVDLTVGVFNSNNTNTRAISFGTNNIILATTTAAQTVLNMATATGFTYTGTGGFISDASVTRTFNFGATIGGTNATAPNLSFTGSGTAVQTFQSGGKFGNLSFGTTAFNPGTTALSLNGLTLSSGGTFSTLTATMFGTGTITSNGNTTLTTLNINGVGILSTLGDALTMAATGTVTITNGTLALNVYDLTTGIFASSGTGTRSISFGSNNIVLAHTTAATVVLSFATATGFTWTGTGGFRTDASITRTVTFGTTGGSATNAPNLSLTGSGTSVITLTTASWFNNLSFGTTAFNPGTTTLNLNSLSLSSGGTFTTMTATMVGTGTITPNGNTTLGVLTINSTTGTTTLGAALTLNTNATTTLTSGTLTLNGFDLTTGIFSSNNATSRAISFGTNNIVLAHTTAATTVLAMPIVTNFTNTGTGGFVTDASITRTVTFGTTGGSTTNSPNLALTGSGTSVITFTTGSWFDKLDFGTTAFTIGTTNLNLNSLTLSGGGTFSTLTATMVGTGAITSNGNTTLGTLTINTGAGTTSLNSTFTIAATGTSTLTSGTLNLNGFDLTTGIFSSNNATSRAISFGTNNIVLAHTTAATTVLAMPIVTNFSWTGTGGFTTDASVTRTVTFGTTGGSTTNAPNLTLTGSGVSVITLTTNSWYNKLDFGTTAFTIGTTTLNLNSLSLSSGGTFTTLTAAMRGDGTLISNGNATLAILTINNTGTTTLGSAFALAATGTTTLTAGTLALGGYNLSTGIFSSTGAVTRAISFGSNNISLTHTTSSTVVLSMATVTGFSWTGTGGFTADTSVLNRTYTFGTTGGTSTNAPNLTFTTGNSLIVITTGSWFNKLDFGSTAWSASALTATVNVNSLTLTGTGVFTLTANMIGTGTLTSNGAQLGGPLNINNTSGTTTVVGAVNCTTFTVTSGTIDFANYSLTCNNNGLTGALNSFAPAGTLNLSTITCFSYTVNGSLTMTTGMSLTCTNVFLLSSVAFNYNGGTLSAATFSHASGTVTLGQALTLPNTSTYTMSGGTLDLAGFTLTTGIFTGTGTSARTVSFGSGNIVLAHPTAATTVLSLATATGFTFTGTGGFTTDASITRTLTFGTTGGSSTISPNLTLTGSGTSIITLTTGSWFNKLDFGTTVFTLGTTNLNLNSLSLSSGGSFSSFTATMVGTGTITPNGNTTLNRLTINNTGTTTLGAALTLNTNAITTLTSGTLTLNGFNLTTGQFVSSSGSTRVINFDTGNIILAHTTATTAVLACNDATGFTWTGTGGFVSDASITRTYAFGTTGGSATNSPNLSLTGSGTAIATLTTASWFNKLDFGSTAFVIAATNLNLNNVSLSSGGTFTNLTATMVGTGNITPNGNTTLGPVVINNGSGTTTLPAALSCTTFSMTAGTMDFAFFNLTCSSTFTYVSGTMLNMPTISCTTFTVNGTYTMTAGTITPSVSFVVQSGAFNYNGGTLSAVPTFTHTAGTVTLGQNYSLTATGTYTLTAGTLDLGGFTLTTGIFSSSNTNTRSISFGSGKIVLAHTTSATTVLSMATATGFTNTGTGGFQADASVSRTVTFGTTGGTATNAPNLTYTSGSFGLVITTGSWFKTIDFGTTLGSVSTVTLNLSSYILSTSGTYTGLTANMVGTGTIKGNGKEILALTINNVTGTTTLLDSPVFAAPGSSVTTLTSGTLDLNNFTLTTCSFSSSGALTRSIINGSNNIEVGFTTAGVTAMNMANLTGFSWVGAGGFVCAGLTTLNFIVGTTGGTTSNAPNLSIYAGSGQPLFTDGSLFNTLDFTGSTCTPAMTASVLGIHVSTLTLATGGTYTGFIPVFTRTQTWSMQFSKQLAGIGVNGSGVTLTLNGTQTYTATSQVILTAGTLDLGGYDITVGLFRSSNTNTRSVTFGSNKIILAHTTAATTVLSMATMTGFTCSGAGGFSTNMTVTRTFAIGTTAGGTSVGAPNLFFTGSGTALPTLTTSWLNKLDLSGITSFAAFQFINETSLNLNSFVGAGNAGFNGTYLNLNFVGSGSITNTNQDKIASIKINHNGTTILSTPIIMGTAGVFQNGGQTSGLVTLTSGTLQLDSYIYAAVGISSSNSNVRAITGNNNFYIDGATTSGTTPLNMANATNFTKSGTWRFVTSGTLASTYVFGTTGGSSSNAPSFFHQLMSGATSTFTSGSWFDKLDFTGSQSGAVAPTTTLNLNSLTLGASATYTGLSATMVGTGTITPNGKPIAALVINNGSGTTTLAGALTTNTSTTLTAGNLALAGYTLTPTQFISGGAATRTISGSGTGVISVANDWTVSNGTGFTGSDYTINMTKATAKTFAGAGGTYGKLVQAGAGALTISGSNNFADLQATTRPSTITFTAGTTQYFNLFSLEGTAGNLVTINSTVSGTQYYLSKSGTRVDVSYLSIRDSNVIGGASWFNNNGSNTVLSNNTGWNPISTGAFMAFF